MQTLKIFSDSPLSVAAEKFLTDGVAPHQVMFAANTSVSVLSHAETDSKFGAADIAFGQPDVESILRSTRLRWIHLTSASFTRYDNDEFRATAKERGLLVTNSSSVYAEPCAEHVLSFMLARARNLPAALKTRCPHGTPEWNGVRQGGISLMNQKAVILGYGTIAMHIIELLRPFRMDIVAYRRHARGDEEIPIVNREQLPQALSCADHVINVLPDNADSFHFVSSELFAQMKPGAVFYNIGRGTTVDQNALLQILKSGRLDSAWLDVTEPEPLPDGHPLLSAPNCFITPHTAGGHRNESESLVHHFLKNFRQFVDGSPLFDRIM